MPCSHPLYLVLPTVTDNPGINMYVETRVARGTTDAQHQQIQCAPASWASNFNHQLLGSPANLLPMAPKSACAGMPQNNSMGSLPEPFQDPVFSRGRRDSSPFPSDMGKRAFMLLSESSGRRWHTVSSVRVCGFGEVFRAMELVALPSGAWGHEQSYFAIKVRSINQSSCLPT